MFNRLSSFFNFLHWIFSFEWFILSCKSIWSIIHIASFITNKSSRRLIDIAFPSSADCDRADDDKLRIMDPVVKSCNVRLWWEGADPFPWDWHEDDASLLTFIMMIGVTWFWGEVNAFESNRSSVYNVFFNTIFKWQKWDASIFMRAPNEDVCKKGPMDRNRSNLPVRTLDYVTITGYHVTHALENTKWNKTKQDTCTES